MVTMVMKAGMASERSSRCSSVTPLNIIVPTIIRTGAVAAAGTARKNGEKNSAAMKQTAIVSEVSPDFPP